MRDTYSHRSCGNPNVHAGHAYGHVANYPSGPLRHYWCPGRRA